MDTIDQRTTSHDERSEEPEGGALATVLLGVMVLIVLAATWAMEARIGT